MGNVLARERQLRAAVAAIPATSRAVALRVATLPDEERAQAIGKLYADERLRTFAELLIDLEEEPAARALIVGELWRLSR